MPMQKVEFEFPDPDKAAMADSGVKETENGNFEITIEGRPSDIEAKTDAVSKKAREKEDDVDIEVVDDRPEDDRDKGKLKKKPMELTDEEMESYSERVRKRLQHFSKGYHDERRKAEEATRQREEALRYAQQIAEENKKLKGTVNQNQTVLLEQAKRVATTELEQAKAAFKRAYDAGDSDKLVAAQEALTAAKMKADRIANIKVPSLQEEEKEVQTQQFAPEPVVDTRARDWQSANPWFGQDDEMTSFALGLHQKLVKQGVDPRSDEYYDAINRRMRQVFPDTFSEEETGDYDEGRVEPRRKANVVAPATRSVAPKKITLSRTQVAIAKRLGVPLAEYAKQVAVEMRKQNG